MADGTRLAARLWLPAATSRPAPALLEYVPYRKRDGTRPRDEPMHGWFAAHGYAVVRLDLRGSGDSDGTLDDEYLPRELDDAVEAIAWIARQAWCDGAVGMMGKSWGGFNALQVAALRPPALKAILAVCSTDDRFADDIHFKGGCVLGDNLWWGAIMLAYQSRPPDPAIVGDAWRARWLERLEAMPHWPTLWLAHQRRDAYWRHGSVCEDYSAIEVPVFAVGGWADAYTNAVPRLLEGLRVPCLGLIGPWGHLYPHDGAPGPAIGFLQEALRWWDHWLKGVDSGIMREPTLRAYVEDWTPPGDRERVPGRWVGERAWPSPRVARRTLEAGALGLDRGGAATTASLASPSRTGVAAGEWMGTGVAGQAAGDQRIDDAHSLVFDSAPLAERVEILGAPQIEFDVASDRPVAQLCARLCDVAPDGSSRRVSYGVLNLAHRDGHAAPSPMPVGDFVRVRLKLDDCGHAFASGHVVRLALSSAYWPMVWPAPEVATLTFRLPGTLVLPVRPPDPRDAEIAFARPERGPATPTTKVSEGAQSRRSSFDPSTGESTTVVEGRGGLFGEGAVRLDDIGTTVAHDLRREFSIRADDPSSASQRVIQSYSMEMAGVAFRIETVSTMTATPTHFRLRSRLAATQDGAPAFEREWVDEIARDLT
ncbi:MAG: CocE/NonD family hydrolase [Hyphomicrobiales bacterium]|nr:CocE/NonD family hydrolase [Hyphomicrobiales bacterium]